MFCGDNVQKYKYDVNKQLVSNLQYQYINYKFQNVIKYNQK